MNSVQEVVRFARILKIKNKTLIKNNQTQEGKNGLPPDNGHGGQGNPEHLHQPTWEIPQEVQPQEPIHHGPC